MRSALSADSGWTRVATDLDAVALAANDLSDQLASGDLEGGLVVIEAVEELTIGAVADSVERFLKLARSSSLTVLVEGDLKTVGASFGLGLLVRSSRQGIVLRPNGPDLESMFEVSVGTVKPRDFPVGRGFLVRNNAATRVQLAVVEP
jgi:hypothetical protein